MARGAVKQRAKQQPKVAAPRRRQKQPKSWEEQLFFSRLRNHAKWMFVFLALPAAVHFLTNYDSGLYNVQVRASNYLSFAVQVLVAVGVVLELPIFVLALVRIGVLTTAKLRANRKLGYFIVLIVGVCLPGVDPVTTLMETIPLFVLYEGSIWLSVLVDRRTGAVPATET